jgi:CRP-like cAMP-binding protein
MSQNDAKDQLNTSPKLTLKVQEYLASTNTMEQKKILAQIQEELQKKNSTLLQFIQSLGEALVNQDEVRRAKGTVLLGEVLQLVALQQQQPHGAEWLQENDVAYLFQFLLSRLGDWGTQSECIFALHILLHHYCAGRIESANDSRSELQHERHRGITLTSTQLYALLQSVTEHVHAQSLPQPTRKLIYELLAFVFVHHKSTLAASTLGSDWVFGLIQCMDGEKDPRNLLLCFSLVRDAMTQLPAQCYARFAEELYEITSCYFPITFNERAPRDDESATTPTITRVALVEALRECLAASPLLAEYVIPFLLDKLSSTLLDTKRDALETLAHCVERYVQGGWGTGPWLQSTSTSSTRSSDAFVPTESTASSPLNIFASIWAALRQELMNSTDPDLISLAVDTLRRLVHAFAQLHSPSDQHVALSFDSTPSALSLFLTPLIRDCQHHLDTVADSKLALLSARILTESARAHPLASALVLRAIVPFVTSQIKHLQLQQHSAAYNASVRVLSDLLHAVRDFRCTPHPLSPYAPELYALLVQIEDDACHDPTKIESAENALRALVVLAVAEGTLLNAAQYSALARLLVERLLHSPSLPLRTAALQCLLALCASVTSSSSTSLAAVRSDVLPLLQSVLTQHSVSATTSSSASSTVLLPSEQSIALYTLTALATTHPVLFREILPILCAQLTTRDVATLDVEFVTAVLSAITSCVRTRCNAVVNDDTRGVRGVWLEADEATLSYLKTLVPLALTSAHAEIVLRYLAPLTAAVACVLPSSSVVTHRWVVDELLPLYLTQDATVASTLFRLSSAPSPRTSPLKVAEVLCLCTLLTVSPSVFAHMTATQQTALLHTLYRQIVSDALPSSATTPHFASTASSTSQQPPDLSSLHDLRVRALAACVNKGDAEVVTAFVMGILSTLVDIILAIHSSSPLSSSSSSSASSLSRRLDAVLLLVWVTRAVTRRGLSLWSELWSRLVYLLDTLSSQDEDHQHVALYLTHLFALLLNDTDSSASTSSLSASNSSTAHPAFVVASQVTATATSTSNIPFQFPPVSTLLTVEVPISQLMPIRKVLYKQKTFVHCLPRLLEGTRHANAVIRHRYVQALCRLVVQVPIEVLLSHTTSLLPILFEQLQAGVDSGGAILDRDETLLAVMSLLCVLAQQTPNLINEHLHSIVPRLLTLSTRAERMKVRVAALTFLWHLAHLPYHVVYPYKSQVLTALLPALDDKKRFVRQQAVKTRNEWFVLSQTPRQHTAANKMRQ